MSVAQLYQAVRTEISKVVFGQDDVVEFALAALFSSGHILLEGPPGVAKTLLVRTIASTLDLEYRRVQMTPDLLPGDITGSSIYREGSGSFEFRKGPLFANFVLADEVNRASARTQSALLEAMQELSVTHDGVTHALPEPFIVFATQNPLEQDGTYPLPLAQLDRFMFKVRVDYPPDEEERRILLMHHGSGGLSDPKRMGVGAIVKAEHILAARKAIRETHIREEVAAYVQKLLVATRRNDSLSVSRSPRAGLMLLMGAKSLAQFAGRDFVTPDDVQSAFRPALRHRVVLHPTSELEGTTSDEVLAEVLEAVEVPR